MSLLEQLRVAGIDDRDIGVILMFASGGGSRTISLGSTEFLTNDATPELFARVRFKNGRVSLIEPGRRLQSLAAQNALVERAKGEVAENHGYMVVSRVLFSERRLTGTFSWSDSIRLSPCTNIANIGRGLNWFDIEIPGLKTNGHLGPPFPMLLEVRIPRSPNLFLQSNRMLRSLDRYQFLLTLLLNGNLGMVHWPNNPIWATLKQNDAIENHLVQPSFSTSESGQQDDFLTTEYPAAPIYTGDDYYERLWPRDTELHIPSTLSSHLETFQALNKHSADAFLRACYWYAVGVQFRMETSLAIVSFSTAIECLLPRLSTKSCLSCGKPTGAGPTQLFKQHIKRYGKVTAALESQRDSLYAVRSALVHGTHASQVDIDFFSGQGKDRDHSLLLSIVAQRSLINWLVDPERDARCAVNQKN